ncbi:MAG: alpha/beta hydrolase [Alphaproteobacteria bacterium]
MSFDDLPPLPPLIHPEANGYAIRCMAATRRVQAEANVAIDLAYGGDYWQKLDIYRPKRIDPAAGLPVLVFFHGGAWTNGTKEWMGFMAPPLTDIPIVYVAANYRLAPAIRYPTIVEDCMAATAWVRDNIRAYGGDPERLYVGGHSAGGHLAALVALDSGRGQAMGLPQGAIKACLTISAAFDFRARDALAGTMERRVYEQVLAREADDEPASPIVHVRRNAPPFFIAWGERDFPRLIKQGNAMAAALKQSGVAVETMVIPETDHFEANEVCASPDSGWSVAARRWLTK